MRYIALALVSLYLIWGSTFLAIRYALESLPPFGFSGLRFLTAGLLLCAWRMSRGLRASRREWAAAALVGTLLLGFGNGTVAWAEQSISSGQAALMVATMPMWMALLEWIGPDRKYPGHTTLAGILLGTLGVTTLVGAPGQGSLGSLVVVAGAFSWALGSLLSRRLPKPSDTFLFSGMTMACAGVVLSLVSVLLGESWQGGITLSAGLAWVYLVTFGSIVGLTSYTYLLARVTPTLASTYTYVNPVVAVLLAWGTGEALPEALPLAATLVIAGVALISLRGVSFPARVFQPHLGMLGDPWPSRRVA